MSRLETLKLLSSSAILKLAALPFKIKRDLQHLGNDYGGWMVSIKDLPENGTVYSCGVGLDISFDLEIIQKYGATVYAFDPTPEVAVWIKKQKLPKKFHYFQAAIAGENSTSRFFLPAKPGYISHTLIPKVYSDKFINVKVNTLDKITEKLGHKTIDLLKLDIEGSEYDVIKQLSQKPLVIRQIAVEFHHRFGNPGLSGTLRSLFILYGLGYKIAYVSPYSDHFTFVLAADQKNKLYQAKQLYRQLRNSQIRIKNIIKFKIAVMKKPIKIIVGSSGTGQPGWAISEENFLNLLRKSDWNSFFRLSSVNAILAEHVWEHLTSDEGAMAAKICYEFLSEGGYLRVAVPDGFFPSARYINSVKPNGSGIGADDHKVLYNHKTLSKLFQTAGFSVKLLEYFDKSGRFHYRSWDIKSGYVERSARHDKRNHGGKLRYTSLIIDAFKP